MSDESSAKTGWIKVYHPSGVLVTLPVTAEAQDYPGMFARVGEIMAAGFLATAPGTEPGETKQEIGWVLRRSKSNDDNTETPIIDLYAADDRMTWKVLSVYLNRDEDVAAFERCSGLALNALQVFPGTAAPERGSNKQTDRFIVKVPHAAFAVVMKDNPKHNPNETDATKKKPKRLFVRWFDTGVATAPAPAATGEIDGPPLQTAAVRDWGNRITAAKTPEELNRLLPEFGQMPRGDDKETVRGMFGERSTQAGWQWNQDIKGYVGPRPTPGQRVQELKGSVPGLTTGSALAGAGAK